ncbi:hypothetical protein Tco_0237972 [Tanacetum coccineum]
MFEKEKLSGNNFNEWFARLKVRLREREENSMSLKQPLLLLFFLSMLLNQCLFDQWTALYDAHTEIACLMPGSMTPEFHRQFELYYPFDMIQELRSMFEKQARVEKFDLIQSFHAANEGGGKIFSVGLILTGLTKDFEGFAETPQGNDDLNPEGQKKSLNAKGKNKVKGKGKDKKDYIPKPKNPKPTAMEHPAKDDAYHHYKHASFKDPFMVLSKHQEAGIKDLMRKFKRLREVTFILGIKINRDKSKRLIGLGQNAYMDKILKRYKMDNSKRGHIPMQETLDFNKSQNPGELYWTAVKNILKYLRNTKDMFLVYGGNPSTELRVECYWDAGFRTTRDDNEVSDRIFYQSNTSIFQNCHGSCFDQEVLSHGLYSKPTINEPLNMYYDNSTAVHYANEPGIQRGARHYQ